MKDRATWDRMHKAHQVAPVVAVLHGGQGTPLIQTPYFPQDRFQPNAMLVHGPQLNRGMRIGGGDLAQERTQTLLEVRLRLGGCMDMAWSRRAQPCAEPPQIDPTQLPADRSR
jgi:hypothetical protein